MKEGSHAGICLAYFFYKSTDSNSLGRGACPAGLQSQSALGDHARDRKHASQSPGWRLADVAEYLQRLGLYSAYSDQQVQRQESARRLGLVASGRADTDCAYCP